MAQGRSSYQAEDGLHHTSDDPNAQFTPHQPQYDQGFMGMDLFKDSNILLDQLISANAGIHGQQTHAGTTPTLISSPGNQSATASSAFTSPHLTTPPTSYDHQPFPNNISLVPLFSSTSASTAPQGGHVPINAFEQGYSGSSSSTAFPPLFTTNAPVAGPSRPRSLSPASAHPLLGAIHSSEEHEVSIDALLRQCDQKDMESRLTDYSNFAFNPQLQMEWLRIVYNWVVREVEPSREDHFHFLSAHHAPITQKTGGPGSRGGAQAYTCLWPGCGKELKSRADRAQEHILEHLEIKPFLCANCNIASFLRKNDCSRHEKTCKTSSTSSKGIKRKTGARGAAPYPELNTRRTNVTRTSSPSASRSATDSPIARMNLLQMSPLHMTSPLSPSSVSPQQFFMADAVPSSSPTQTRYAEAQLQSPLRGYPMQLPAASSSVPVAGANGLLFQHMPPSMMPSPHHPSYSMPTFNQFDVQRSLPSSLPYHYPNSNGSNDSFMPMQGSSDSHQPFPHM